jgi:hypothetical protein
LLSWQTARVLYEGESGGAQLAEWRKQYPKYNASNLETEGVLNVEHNPWVFVHQDHPIIDILRANTSLIGCKLEDQPKIDHEWYKVARQVLSVCCMALRKDVLKDSTSHDLNLFQVQANRLNAEGWDDYANIQAIMGTDMNPDAAAVEKIIKTPYTYMARIQIDYELQSVST